MINIILLVIGILIFLEAIICFFFPKELKKTLIKIKNKNFLTYGFNNKANYQILNNEYKKNSSIFDLKISIPSLKKKIIKKHKKSNEGS